MSTGNWYNSDGLYLEYGTTKAVTENSGEYKTYGDFRELNFRVTLTSLSTTPLIIAQTVKFPITPFRIMRADVIATVAATSAGTPTIDIGLIKEDRSTELDYNGIVAAQAFSTIDGLGETTSTTFGTTYAGALMGTVASATDIGYLTINTTSGGGSSVFTAGELDIRIFLNVRGTITQ